MHAAGKPSENGFSFRTSRSRVAVPLTAVRMPASLPRRVLAECIGTYLLVLFGTGSVASAVTTGSLQGLWQVAVVWGFGVAISIFSVAAVSGAHLNPAVSFALAIRRPRDFKWRHLLPYWGGQLLGSTLAGATILLTFGTAIEAFEKRNGITRGRGVNDTLSAMVFGEYFPDPSGLDDIVISSAGAAGIEAFGTMILMFVILALTDDRNAARPPPQMVPFFIGFTVSILISLFAPLTQAGWNPARDFGPRIVAALAGWGAAAIPGPHYGFWAYIVGPLVGAPIGAVAYDLLIAPGLDGGGDGDAKDKAAGRQRNERRDGGAGGKGGQGGEEDCGTRYAAGAAGGAAGGAATHTILPVGMGDEDRAPPGMWASDQAVLLSLVRQACAQACNPQPLAPVSRGGRGGGAVSYTSMAEEGAPAADGCGARCSGSRDNNGADGKEGPGGQSSGGLELTTLAISASSGVV